MCKITGKRGAKGGGKIVRTTGEELGKTRCTKNYSAHLSEETGLRSPSTEEGTKEATKKGKKKKKEKIFKTK